MCLFKADLSSLRHTCAKYVDEVAAVSGSIQNIEVIKFQTQVKRTFVSKVQKN